MAKQPKILLWDLETSLSVLAAFSLYPNFIDHKNIIKEPFILCGAYKWLGKKTVKGIRLTKKELLAGDDRRIVEHLCNVVREADIVVGHNGDKFDLKWLKGRAIFHDLPPVNHVKTIDTLKVARRYGRLLSNRLDYLGHLLLGEGKLHTSPGLWMRCLEGDLDALKEMLDYNKVDVELLEKVYLRYRPWIENHPNVAVIIKGTQETCKACGSNKTHKNGIFHSQAKRYQKYKCKACGHSFRNTKAIKE
jgi:DNA polymerase III epsilon subunit-like protein